MWTAILLLRENNHDSGARGLELLREYEGLTLLVRTETHWLECVHKSRLVDALVNTTAGSSFLSTRDMHVFVKRIDIQINVRQYLLDLTYMDTVPSRTMLGAKGVKFHYYFIINK